MEEVLKQILEQLSQMNGRMDNMERRIANIEHEQKQMNYRMTGIENEQKSLREEMNQRFDELKNAVNRKHIENIRADELILQSLDEVKESVRFVNRRIADTELDVNVMKKSLKQ
jgi:predicted  nucleic acid-binding Zn-ribbon protein